jgi:transcriptional regulator with XRE-family HTH domain
VEHDETLGERIRRLRVQQGLSLAKVVGEDVSRAFLNQVEMGKARPSIRVLRLLAERLGTEVEYLLEGRQAGVDRELSLEKGRVLVAMGEPKRALTALRAAVNAYDWPLGTDARLTQAEALIALGRKDEALEILRRERNEIELRNDHRRRERMQLIERGKAYRVPADPVGSHLRMADRAQRVGNAHDELEHYRAARVLLEAGLPAPEPATSPKET